MAGENPQTTMPPVPREPIVDRSGQMSAQWARWIQQIQRVLSFAGGIAWGIVNKASSSLQDLEFRTHAMLQEVLGWASDADASKVRHISNADGKVWQDHVEIVDGNPHGTDHAMLDAVLQADDTSTNTDGGKHVTSAQVKKYEDHRNDTDIHHTLEAIQDNIVGMLTEGNAVTLTYDDTAGTLTVDVVAAAASADVTITVTGTAGLLYSATEQGIINALITDVTAIKNGQNDLKAKMRTAGSLA